MMAPRDGTRFDWTRRAPPPMMTATQWSMEQARGARRLAGCRARVGGGVAEQYDLLLSGGTVLDPASGRQGRFDVGVREGRIAAIEPRLAPEGAARVLDVAGRYVTPGLVDFHVHAYWGVNEFGYDVDPQCMA